MTPDAIMIFAAGFGSRMGDLTKDRPKPLIPVAGKPLIDHALDLATRAGLTRKLANAHYLAPMIDAHLTPKGVTVITETDEILETGGGLRNALPHLGLGPVYTLNPDAIFAGPNPLGLLAGAWDPDEMDALLCCVAPEQAIGHKGAGDFTLSETGTLTRGPGLIYTGAQIIKTDLLHDIPETAFSLNRLWDRMQPLDRLHGIVYPGQWCDVGHPEGIALAESMLERANV